MGTVSALAASGLFTRALASACGITPKQTKGPFYPVADQLDKNTDLTWVEGHASRAKGQVVTVRGIVQDQFCKPVSGALVEIWQACESGRYNHPQDTNTAPVDPDFQYWGQALTDAQGNYSFKTIVPGAYPADVGWTRPPHIHFRVTRLGYHEMITQLYFEGDPLNDQDKILLAIPAGERKSVVVPLVDATPELEVNSKTAEFSLTIQKA